MNTTLKKDNLVLLVESPNLPNLIKETNESLILIYSNLEPIPQITSKEIDQIAGAILRSVAIYDSKYLYPTNTEKLSFVFYTLVKGHFLSNGNKRTAARIFLLFTLMLIEDLSNTPDDKFSFIFKETAEKAIFIAESESSKKEDVMKEIETWVSNVLKRLDIEN